MESWVEEETTVEETSKGLGLGSQSTRTVAGVSALRLVTQATAVALLVFQNQRQKYLAWPTEKRDQTVVQSSYKKFTCYFTKKEIQ